MCPRKIFPTETGIYRKFLRNVATCSPTLHDLNSCPIVLNENCS